MKKLLIIVSVIIILVIGLLITYFYEIGAVSNKSKEVTFTVNENETYSTLADDLMKAKLIRSEFFYKIYIKINKPKNLQKGVYTLNQNMDLKKIISILEGGSTYVDSVKMTFKEGTNMRDYIKVITSNTDIKEEEIIAKLKDSDYLDTLIQKYWFLNSDIKNVNIYYSLEGYLYPDTYEFNKEASIEDIFSKMLDNTSVKLDKYKISLTNNKYTLHQLLTLASIVEVESSTSRKTVASVFYNRLNSNMTLGSDVTTYYGAKVNMADRDLYAAELNAVNGYNTRTSAMAGKLPIGPICSPTISSIEAVLTPDTTNYYYFVADKNKKTYFSRTYQEHLTTIQKLKNEGLWYTYDK